MFDIAIIGAGPAGATLARLLGGSYKVLVLDRRPLDIERPCAPAGDISAAGELSPTKCCGGLLAPDAQRMLACLGLTLPENVLGGDQLFAVRAIDLPSGLERFYQRHYVNIDREQFDRYLVRLMGPGADLRCQCRVRDIRRIREAFDIEYERGGRRYVEKARLVVGADGAGSLVRAKLVGVNGASRQASRPTTYVAIQEWFESISTMPYYGAIFDPEITDYYSWTIPKGQFLLVGSALKRDASCVARFEMLKKKLLSLGMIPPHRVWREACLLCRPGSLRDLCLGGEGWTLIGEAAGWISPSSGEGISYALSSAAALAASLSGGLDGFLARYGRLSANLRGNIMLKNLKRRLIYTDFVRRAGLRLGIGSIRVATTSNDAVVAPA